MTTVSDPRQTSIPSIVYDEPPIKPPPALVVGPIGWARKNLFSSWLNTLLTILTGGLLVTIVTTFVNWVVTQANWSVIIYNLRQFLVGRYTPDAEWRLQLMVVIIAFVLGVGMAAWSRFSRLIAVLAVVGVVLSFVLPVAISTIPLPPSYLTAGQATIVSGSSNQLPQPQIGFIAREGETISLQLATDLTGSDADLRTLNSFADNGSNLLRASANNRLGNQARIDEIDRLLQEHRTNGPTLTATQITALQAERDRVVVPEPVTETYSMNTSPVHIRLLQGAALEPIAEGTLEPDGEPFEFTLPADGWYVLEKSVEGDSAIGLIEARGIYPLLERSFSRSEVLDEAGNVVSSAGRYSQYVRLTDNFLTEAIRPRIERTDVPMTIIIDNQYRGQSTLSDFLTLYVGPFLELINNGLLWIVLAAAVGYIGARLADSYIPSAAKARNPRVVSRRASTWLLIALPVVMFILAYGAGSVLPITDTRRWGGLLLTIMLTMVGIIASFPIGVLLALGRRSSLPVVSAACTIYIEFVRGVPLITVLFMAQLLVPLVNPTLAEVDNVFRAMVGITLFSAAYLAENVRGGLQAIPPGQEEAAKAVGLATWQVILFVTLPQALRLVIPALVGQFISLFKDTSLVAIVGLVDLTGIAQSTVAQTEFLGLRREVYVFITLVYFGFSYAMAAMSRRLEASGSGSARRI